MFRRYPYPAWLVLSIILWSINILHFHAHRQEMLPEKMADAINTDLARRIDAFDDLLKNSTLFTRAFGDSLTEKEEAQLTALPFNVYGFRDSALVFWNSNTVLASAADTLSDAPAIRSNEKGIFIRKCVHLPGANEKIVVLFPVYISYPLENKYLHSHFAASDNIPVKAQVTQRRLSQGDDALVVHGNTVAYIHLSPGDIQRWTPDPLLLLMLLIALITSVSWAQHMAVHLAKVRSPLTGFLFIAGTIAVCKLLLYRFGLPFNLDTNQFFSPSLFASSLYLSSLGDLFIDISGLLWLLLFVARHTDYRSYFRILQSPAARMVIGVLLQVLFIGYIFLYISIVHSLVLDSNISYDVTHFYSISMFTVMGLSAIVALTCLSVAMAYFFNIQFSILIGKRGFKYVLMAVVGAVYVMVSGGGTNLLNWYVLAVMLLFVILLDIRQLALVSNVFEPHMVVWAILICLCSTGLVHYFNQMKERLTRLSFVEQHLSPHRDDETELSFDKTAKNIEKDKQLKSFFYKPVGTSRKAIDQHIESEYLTGSINKYDVKLFLFDATHNPLFNKDTTDFNTLVNEKSESAITSSPYLFYKESILDRHYYLSYIPVYADTVNNVVGYVILDLDLKKASETVYPELLQPATNKSLEEYSEYAYAVYINGKLVTQTNDFPFPVTLRYDTLHEQQYVFNKEQGIAELYYKIADKRTVVVVHYHNELIETFTLFSYLFGIQVVLAFLIFLYQLYLSYLSHQFLGSKFIRFTLRRRLHFSMLLVVLVSFSVMGFVTIRFFTSEYRDTNDNKLQSALQVAKQSVQDYLAQKNAFDHDFIFDSVSRSTPFKYFITNLANSQKIDINIYDDQGTLFATSQEDIYDKGLISRKMRPDAYFQLNTLGRSLVIQTEKVAKLAYNSAYQPLRDEHGVTLGYINVPFFTSERDLNFQISNIVITLINLYAFIFLISSFFTLAVTRWITRTFNLIIRQFDKLNLERNERIEWPYDDEIGRLVTEYNKMVKKVEENAVRLAQSERETAWREMARQVAHEIKNPLTPMKLNIQYLQQAMKGDNPNIKQLTERVSSSIIEQIDNLSYIASEFSNFAKMPEARPEEIEVGELLKTALELYTNRELLDVEVSLPDEKVMVVSDRSQLLRVFTNILENAAQAIPEGRAGHISVSLQQEEVAVLIAVADNGTGIDEQVARRIFQPYFTTKSSGTGLGLAMTRKIIEFWKGEIWFETTECEGTVFFVRLPRLTN